MPGTNSIDIGIAQANKSYVKSVFYMEHSNYAYSAYKGELWTDGDGDEYGDTFDTNDIITMKINFENMTICWLKNDKTFEAKTIINADDGYKMAVYMNARDHSVELLSLNVE